MKRNKAGQHNRLPSTPLQGDLGTDGKEVQEPGVRGPGEKVLGCGAAGTDPEVGSDLQCWMAGAELEA